MGAIERYNMMRDRELHAFECSPLGEHVREALNNPGEELCICLPGCLAAEYAFGARMPAFYAGRSLRLW